jgi:hypothetical protein
MLLELWLHAAHAVGLAGPRISDQNKDSYEGISTGYFLPTVKHDTLCLSHRGLLSKDY